MPRGCSWKLRGVGVNEGWLPFAKYPTNAQVNLWVSLSAITFSKLVQTLPFLNQRVARNNARATACPLGRGIAFWLRYGKNSALDLAISDKVGWGLAPHSARATATHRARPVWADAQSKELSAMGRHGAGGAVMTPHAHP